MRADDDGSKTKPVTLDGSGAAGPVRLRRPARLHLYLPVGGPKLQPALGTDSPIPAGPYRISKTWAVSGKFSRWSDPYTIVARNGQCVAGHIPSREIAEEICRRLNRR